MECSECKYYHPEAKTLYEMCTYDSEDWILPCDEIYDNNPFITESANEAKILYAVINLTALIDEIKHSECNLREHFQHYNLGYLNALNVVLETMLVNNNEEE